jgi:ABC-type transporter Mla MlaB component
MGGEVFSFFRKDKGGSLMDFIKEGLPHKAEQPGFRVGKESAAPGMGDIEVQETDSGLPPDLEEAAVLYANGKVGEAAAQLNRYLLDHPDNKDPEPWYMLFDLYEASDQVEHFEDAAVDFAVRFEVSPPTWSPRAQLHSEQKVTQPLFSFGKEFGHAEQARLARFTADALEVPGVRLDFTNTPLPNEEYTRAILETLVQLQNGQRYIKPIGAQSLITKLKAARAEDGLSEPGWLLLLSLLQLLGLEKEFDDTAIDYAVRFEMSPPTYTPPVPAKASTANRSGTIQNGFTFSFLDVIGPGSEEQFVALAHFAEELPRVEIDLSQVTRIDFACVGLLLDTLINLTAGGRKILIKEGNELVNTLLQVIGANHFASIVGRTRG